MTPQLPYAITDFTTLQVYSPEHSFLRLHPTCCGAAQSNCLSRCEYEALQLIRAILQGQFDYWTVEGNINFATDLADLADMTTATPVVLPLPLVSECYTFEYGIQVGSDELEGDTINWKRFFIAAIPVCNTERAWLAHVIHENNITDELETFYQFAVLSETPGATEDMLAGNAPTLLPPLSHNIAPEGYQDSDDILDTWTECEPVSSPCLSDNEPRILLSPCDRITLPLYVWSCDEEAELPDITFALKTCIGDPIELRQALLHTVAGAKPLSRILCQNDDTPNSEYRLYELFIPGDLAAGCYHLTATDENEDVWCSDSFLVGEDCYTRLVRYRSRESCFDFIYQDGSGNELGAGWQQIRLPIELKDMQPDHTRKVYLKSTGETVKLAERLSKGYTLDTNYLNEVLHERMVNALAHDFFEVFSDTHHEWRGYVARSEYKIEWPNKYHLGRGSIELTATPYNRNNPYT